MWNEWRRVFSETKAKSRLERELVTFLSHPQTQPKALDFPVATGSHIPAQGGQVIFREQSVWVQSCSKGRTEQCPHWTWPKSLAPIPSAGNGTQVATAGTEHCTNSRTPPEATATRARPHVGGWHETMVMAMARHCKRPEKMVRFRSSEL